ncbi:MAG: RNA polymerase sporulation sigma factor SigK [Clostridiales bacterium]|jgi:RNA polymerase sporulation-specific sigma factor|nr:RNA polymerase sporulation sigma factor SigK [Clostridiales bacterium]
MIWESFFAFISKVFFFTSYVNNKGSFPKPLSQEEEMEYLDRVAQGDKFAQEMLVRHNLRLVVHISKKYSSSGVDADDLISTGAIGLIKAINSFKQGKGSALATYAARCIENEILMYLRGNKKHRQTVSLFETICIDKDGNEVTRMDILPDKSESISDNVEKRVMYDNIVVDMLRVLSDREREIIIMRFGLNNQRPMTQIEVANKLEICRSYVSRIEKKAISKLRDARLNF